MAGLAPLLLLRLSLSTCCVLLLLLLAACPSLAIAPPCQQTSPMSAFNTFEERHLPEGTPDSLDQNAWFKFIKANTPDCNRPTQSFLHPDMLDQVKAVCSSQGGKVYNKDEDDLCISKETFTFVTVRSEPGTCEIFSVKPETKYLILACDKVNNNHCLPVHFEGNPDDAKPDNNARDCEAPPVTAPPVTAPPVTTSNLHNADTNDAGTPTWLWLITSVMVLIV